MTSNHVACGLALAAALALAGCGQSSTPAGAPPVPADLGQLLADARLYEVTARDGRLCMTVGKLTILFEGIPVADDGRGARNISNFQTPQPSVTAENMHQLGSNHVRVTQGSGTATTLDVKVNDYAMRLVDGGKALEIDGAKYGFDEPQTVIIGKDGKATKQAP